MCKENGLTCRFLRQWSQLPPKPWISTTEPSEEAELELSFLTYLTLQPRQLQVRDGESTPLVGIAGVLAGGALDGGESCESDSDSGYVRPHRKAKENRSTKIEDILPSFSWLLNFQIVSPKLVS